MVPVSTPAPRRGRRALFAGLRYSAATLAGIVGGVLLTLVIGQTPQQITEVHVNNIINTSGDYIESFG